MSEVLGAKDVPKATVSVNDSTHTPEMKTRKANAEKGFKETRHPKRKKWLTEGVR